MAQTVITLYWTDFKAIVLDNFLYYYWTESNNAYVIHADADNIVYKCIIYTGTSQDPNYSQQQNDADKANFTNLYQNFYSQLNITTTNTYINYRYTEFKSIVSYKNLNPQYIQYPESYLLFAFDGQIVYRSIIYTVAMTIPNYSSSAMAADLATFTNDKSTLFNKNIVGMTTQGVMRVANEKPTDSKRTFISHNFSDKTTWYTNSVLVQGETLVNSGDNLTYSASHTYIVDVTHGKITREDLLTPMSASGVPITTVTSYAIAVNVNGTRVNEVSASTGVGDYVVDYVNGKITFQVARQPTDVVTCTYWYATNNCFTIYTTGFNFNLGVNSIVVRLTNDVQLNDTFCYQAFGLVDIVAPQAVQYGLIPSGTMVPINQMIKYKRIADFMNDCQVTQTCDPVGGTGWRGLNIPTIIFNIDYLSTIVMPTAYGAELRIWTENSEIITGTLSNTTFYCQEVSKISGLSL